MTNGAEDEERFGEARFRQILRLAIEIDERTASTIDLVELRKIAATVGISPNALDEALEELHRSEEARRRALKYLRRVRRILAVATGAVLGLLSTLMQMLFGFGAGANAMLATAVLLVAVVLLLVAYNRSRSDQRTYQIDNAAIWTAFTLASRPVSAAAGGVPAGVLAWFGLTVLGFVLIGGRRAEPPSLSRDVVIDKVIGSIRDRIDRDVGAERRRISGHEETPVGLTGQTLPAAT